MTTAGELLHRGHGVLDARAKDYDQAGGERNAWKVAACWSAATGKPMTEYEAWLFLVFLKAVRLTSAPGPHDDSAMDGAVYFALAGESKHRQQAQEAEDGPGPESGSRNDVQRKRGKPPVATAVSGGQRAAPRPDQDFVEFRVPVITPDPNGEWYRAMDRAAERQTTVCTTVDVVHRWLESRSAVTSAYRRNGLVPKFHQVRANGWRSHRPYSGRGLYVLSLELADLDLTASQRPFDDGTIIQPQTGEPFPPVPAAVGLTAEEKAPADPNQYAGCGVDPVRQFRAQSLDWLDREIRKQHDQASFAWVTINDDRPRPCHSFSFTSHSEIDRDRFLSDTHNIKIAIDLDASKLANDVTATLKPVVDGWVANVVADVFGPAVSGYPTVPTWAQSMADAGPAAARAGVLVGPWGEVTAKGWGRSWLFTGRDGLPWMQPDDGGKPLPIHEDATVRQVAGYTPPVGWAIFANNVSGRCEWGRVKLDELNIRRRTVFNPKIPAATDPPVWVIMVQPSTTGSQDVWLNQIDRVVKAGRKVACQQWAMRRWHDSRAGQYTTVLVTRDDGPDFLDGYPAWTVKLGDPITKPAAPGSVTGSRLPSPQRMAMQMTNAPAVVMDPTGPFPPEHWLDIVDEYAKATGGTVFIPESCMMRWYHERGLARHLCAVKTGQTVAGLPGFTFRKMDLADSGSQTAGRPANIDGTQTVPQAVPPAVSNGRVLGDLERVLVEMEGMSPVGLARAGRKLEDVLAKLPQWAAAAQRRQDVPTPTGSGPHDAVPNEQTRRPEETKATPGGTGVPRP